MIQTSFFKEPTEENKPEEIIQIEPSSFQPRKVEELLPDDDIVPDTYIIYSEGGYHPFYGVLNTLPRYQQRIWPYVKRIKFSEYFKSQESVDRLRNNSQREHQTIEQINPFWDNSYYYISLYKNSYYITNSYTKIKKNGKHSQWKAHLKKKIGLHRLVGLAFVPNPDNKPYVLHKNDDSTNYLHENLKWGTQGENMKGKIRRRPDTMEQKYLNLIDQGIIKG